MESKVPNVEFDKDKIDAESRTNLSSDLFDSKQREIDLAIKKQKLIFLSIKNVSPSGGLHFGYSSRSRSLSFPE